MTCISYFWNWFILSIFTGSFVKGELLGKLVFHSNNDAQASGFSLDILHQPKSVYFAPSPGAIPSDEIASVMALSLGLSVPKDITWAGLQFGDLFNRPKAVMMITVDGLPEGSQLKLPSTRSFAVKKIDEGSVEQIYSVSKHSSLASHVNAIFDGEANTISMAADKRTVAAGYGYGKSSKALFWNDKLEEWKTVREDSSESQVELDKQQLLKSLKLILPKGFEYDKINEMVKLNAKGLQVEYDMNDKVDFMLFSELVNVYHQYEQLKSNKKKIVDGVPDVYLFTLSALQDLEKKYGGDSKQFRGAVYLLEQSIPKAVNGFSELYNGDILVVSVSLPSDVRSFDEHKEEIGQLLKGVKETTNYVTDAFHRFIPEIHVPSHVERAARQKLCDELQGSFSKLSGILKFKCANQEELRTLSRRSLLASKKTGVDKSDLNIDTYDANFAAIFNIWVWLVVVLALALYVISLSMWFMDPGKDSIIYRLTQQRVKAE